MELDRVRRHARLTVVLVEEGHTDDSGPRASPRHFPRIIHLLAPVGGGANLQREEGVSAIIVRVRLRRKR
jgi:hypothetical protein